MVPCFVDTVIVVILLDFWYLDKFEGLDFKYDINFFKFAAMQALRKAFHFDKFEGTDVRYGYNFLNIQPKSIQRRHFWFQV